MFLFTVIFLYILYAQVIFGSNIFILLAISIYVFNFLFYSKNKHRFYQNRFSCSFLVLSMLFLNIFIEGYLKLIYFYVNTFIFIDLCIYIYNIKCFKFCLNMYKWTSKNQNNFCMKKEKKLYSLQCLIYKTFAHLALFFLK